MQPDILAMKEAINDLRYRSVSSNADGSAPCTVSDLQNLRNAIADTLENIVNSMES